jgi:hypothetical protein
MQADVTTELWVLRAGGVSGFVYGQKVAVVEIYLESFLQCRTSYKISLQFAKSPFIFLFNEP